MIGKVQITNTSYGMNAIPKLSNTTIEPSGGFGGGEGYSVALSENSNITLYHSERKTVLQQTFSLLKQIYKLTKILVEVQKKEKNQKNEKKDNSKNKKPKP